MPADETYLRLEGFLRNLFRVLDEAATLSVRDFERRHREIESYHLASGVRHEARCRLEDLGGTEFECELEDMPNNGLQIIYRETAIRVRKSDDGLPPAASQSDAYNLYYEQFPLFPGHSTIENLLVLWEFDYTTLSIGRLFLSKPGVWSMEIPHPVETILPVQPSGDDDFDDLELEPSEEYVVEDDEAENEEG